MKTNIFKKVSLFSICLINLIVYTSDNKQCYEFDDFDKHIFTNQETKKIEAIYSTPFIDSVTCQQNITVFVSVLETLLYPALAYLIYKKDQITNTWWNDYQSQKTGTYERGCEQNMQSIASSLRRLRSLVTVINTNNDYPVLTVKEQDVLRVVQYAAQTIERRHADHVVEITTRYGRKTIVHDAFKDLINKYQNFEHQ